MSIFDYLESASDRRDLEALARQIEAAHSLLDESGLVPKAESLAVRVGLLIDERNSLKDELDGAYEELNRRAL